MIENVTLGEIGLIVGYIVALITGIAFLLSKTKLWLKSALKDEFEPINKNINEMRTDIQQVDLNACKNFLVRSLGDIEKGVPIDEIEKERLWEQYEHYQKIGGNSYIKRKVEQLQNDGKL